MTPLLDRARTDGREGHASHAASNKPWGRHELKRPASLRAALGKPERVAADGNGNGSKEVEGGARPSETYKTGENHGAWHQAAPPPSIAQPLPMDHDRGNSLGEMQCVWDNPPLRDVRMYSPPSTPPDSPASRHSCVLCCSCVAWVRVRAVRCGRWLRDQLAVGCGCRGKDKEDAPDDRDRERAGSGSGRESGTGNGLASSRKGAVAE